MKKSASTCEKHCKIQVAVFLGRNFVWENENPCADFTTRGRKKKHRVAQQLRHLGKTKDQKAPTTVKTMLRQSFVP